MPFHQEETIGPGGGPGGGGQRLRHSLTITAPGHPPQQVELTGRLSIGRAPPAELILPYPEISRRHAEISLAGGQPVVTDLGSTNGVWVDGAQIAAPTALAPGTTLRLGHVLIAYTAEAATTPAASPPPPAAAPSDTPAQGRLDDPALQAAWLAASGGRGHEALSATASRGLYTGFLLNVSGPDPAAKVHAAGIAQLLRQGLPGADPAHPAEAVACLNSDLTERDLSGLVPAIWAWCYDPAARVLEYCSAGHPPGFLVAPDGQTVVALDKRNPSPGLMADFAFGHARLKLRPGCALYLFGAEVFAHTGAGGMPWGLAEAIPLLQGAPVDPGQAVARLQSALGDASVAVFRFP